MIICLVTDRRLLAPEARTLRDEVRVLSGWLEEAVAAGVDLIQLREPDLSGRALSDLARAVKASAAGTSTRVVVNDRADVAIASGCDGVHLRGNGPPVGRARGLAPNAEWVVGRSIHSAEEVREHAAADYLVFGSVFDSGPKAGAGVEALRAAAAAAREVDVPLIAIGGITIERAGALAAAGARGVAAIRLFLPRERGGGAPGVLGLEDVCDQLRAMFDAAGTRHLQ